MRATMFRPWLSRQAVNLVKEIGATTVSDHNRPILETV